MAKRKGNKKAPVPIAIIVAVLLVISAVFEATGIWDKIDTRISGNESSIQTANINDGEIAATVHFIDVGQGDCTLFISGGETMLIDCGEAEYSDTVINALDLLGVESLDYAVATHAHSDHMGSMAEILDTIPTKSIIISEPSEDSASTATYTDFLDAAERSRAEIIVAEPDYTFSLGYTSCRIIAPFKVSSSEENNNSIVMHITAGTTSFLMTGDAEKSVETEIANKYPNLYTTILKVGHHGSNTSSSEALLKAITPEVAVISVGKDNSYGHPTEKVLGRLAEYTSDIYRTDIDGTVTITCYNDSYTVSTER